MNKYRTNFFAYLEKRDPYLYSELETVDNKSLVRPSIENPNDVNSVVQSFLNSEVGKANRLNDCKTVTRAFVNWAKDNGVQANVMLLAPPSTEVIEQRPELKGKSGTGDSHIMPIVAGQTIDFTARQFPGVSATYEKPLIMPLNQAKSYYEKVGGYFTDAPEYFNGGQTSYVGSWDGLPSYFNKSFSDELM